MTEEEQTNNEEPEVAEETAPPFGGELVTMGEAGRVAVDEALGRLDSLATEYGALLEHEPLPQGDQTRQIAKIFMAMSTEEMTPILERLDDDIVYRIVVAMKERDAESVLSSLPPARAARITVRMARAGRVGGAG